MTVEILLLLLVTGGAVWLFVTEKLRADLVALMVLGALVVVGLFEQGRVETGIGAGVQAQGRGA